MLLTVLEDFSANPSLYILGFFATLAFFYFVLVRKRLSLNPIQGLWIVYLLYISIAEEIAFRLLLPIALESSVGFIYAIVLSNLVFALLHYITLRWKWQNCLFVFFGGIGLSRLLENFRRLNVSNFGSLCRNFFEHAIPAGGLAEALLVKGGKVST